MKRPHFFILLLLPLFPATVFFSCGNSSGNLDDLKWMIGQWRGTDKNARVFYENWEREDKNNFSGLGFILNADDDTIYRETLKIESTDGNQYYVYNIPKIKGPVLFKMIKGDDHNAIFENTEHDFPKRISYLLESDNIVKVKLEGIDKGMPKIEMLEYERVTNSPLDNLRNPKTDSAKKDTVVPTTNINL